MEVESQCRLPAPLHHHAKGIQGDHMKASRGGCGAWQQKHSHEKSCAFTEEKNDMYLSCVPTLLNYVLHRKRSTEIDTHVWSGRNLRAAVLLLDRTGI